MKSGIFDKNGIEVKEGDILIFPYLTPMGEIQENYVDFKAEVKFKHGCFGYDTKTGFTPLMVWSKKEEGDYIPHYGNKIIILDKYPFLIQESSK